ncbi:MAG: nucleoside deaminase [Bacteroidales bacterium]|jgi:tRNA(adenine34) deaminase|nr:nucleoside deaminase [Bacteroidales bacterium]
MTENADEKFMKEAIKQAKEAMAKGEVPIGAVIVYEDRIIARACNMVETLNDATAHAEMLAFTSASQEAGKYLNQCTLYVTLEPCPMCLGAAFWTQIRRIVFGASDNRNIIANKNDILHPKTIVQGGVMENECSQLIKDFFKSKR